MADPDVRADDRVARGGDLGRMGAQRLRLNDRERIGGGPAFGMIGQSWDEARAMGDLCEARDDQPLRRAGIAAGREMARPIDDLAEIGRMAVRPRLDVRMVDDPREVHEIGMRRPPPAGSAGCARPD
jgi:hypothetical protein